MVAMARYGIEAFNTAAASENRIHDDSVAKRFGFSGGLVPGVDVYAYMTRAALMAFGRDFMERGWMDCRFGKPVYDGETIEVTAEPGPDGIVVEVITRGQSGATGTARIPDPEPAAPDPATFATAPQPAPADRPAAGPASLVEGSALGTIIETVDAATHTDYLASVRETHPFYAANRVVHPGFILRRANLALKDNVLLGPWIHVGSAVQHHGAMTVGGTMETRSRVRRLYEHKGHGFVELDVLVLGDGQPVASIHHTAIYEPRQVRQG